MAALYGFARWRVTPRIMSVSLCMLLLGALYFTHAWQMGISPSDFFIRRDDFLLYLSICWILLLLAMGFLVISSVLNERFSRLISYFSIIIIGVLTIIFRFSMLNPHEAFGFIDLVIQDFNSLGWIPLPIIYSHELFYTIIMILLSLLVITTFARLLISKSSDWLRLSPATIIPAIIVFSSAIISFNVHLRWADFTLIMVLMQLASFAILMAWCVVMQKTLGEGQQVFRSILGGAAIGFYFSTMLQVFDVPITYNHFHDLWIVVVMSILATAFLIYIIYQYLTKLYETELEASRQERLAAIGRLAAVTAHEIRNPLQAIRGLSQLLGVNISDKESKEVLDVIVKETDHLDIILRRLLEFSREMKLQFEEVDLPKFWNDLKNIAMEMGANAKIKCFFNEAPVIKAIFDNEKIRQVFINLIKNAIEASIKGGTINISVSADKTIITFRVEDEGKGISPEDAEKAFKEFHTTKAEGSGLGLPVSKRIVEAHGGRIYFDLKAAKGASVVVILPLTPPRHILRRYKYEQSQ